jgi:hypothetical protein
MTNKGNKTISTENAMVNGYMNKPWWRNQTHIIDLPSLFEMGITDEGDDGTKIIKKQERIFTIEDYGKMYQEGLAAHDAKLKAAYDKRIKNRTALKKLHKEFNKDG